MPKKIVIDELHLTIRIPAAMPDAEVDIVRETLAGGQFLPRLRHAVRAAIRTWPELAGCRVTVAR